MANPERIGTRRLVVGAHYGTMDFIIQRVTAVIMAVYTVIIFLAYLFTPSITFEAWRGLFSFHVGMLPLGQLLASMAFLSLCWHAWIGVRDIWMDYVRLDGLRLLLQSLTVLWLLASIVFFFKSLWSI